MSAERKRESVAIPLDELPAGSRKLVVSGRREIAVFNIDGEIHAVGNACPHQRASMVTGTVGGTRLPSDVGQFKYGLDNRILRCPWHAYEFDLETGHCLADPDRLKIAVYEVEIGENEVIVHV